MARGSEVSRAIFQGAAGHFWPAGQGLRTTVLELTVCHETNMIHSHDYKKNKYKVFKGFRSMLEGNRRIIPHFIDVITLGFIADISDVA